MSNRTLSALAPSRRSFFPNETAKVRAGMWLRAVAFDDPVASEWCKLNGVVAVTKAQSEGPTNQAGGALVPSEMVNAIFAAREAYGVFRLNAKVVPMKGDTMDFPRRTAGITAAFTPEGTAIADSSAAFDSVGLVARAVKAMIKVSSELWEDSVGDLAEFFAQDCGQAFAKIEDDCGFIGDGTSTYSNMQGLTKLLIDNNHTASKVTATGHATFATIDGTDIASLMSKLPSYAWPNSAFYVSQAGFALTFARLAGTSGMMAAQPDQNGVWRPNYLGRPVIFAPSMTQSAGSSTGVAMILFGDLSLSSLLGSRRDLTLAVSKQRLMDVDQVLVRCTERFHVVNHNIGDTSTPGAMIALVAG